MTPSSDQGGVGRHRLQPRRERRGGLMAVTEMRSEGVALPRGSRQVAGRGDRACRRSTSRSLIALLILLLPLFALIAIADTLDSPGPVLFRQRRFGLGLSGVHDEQVQDDAPGRVGAPAPGVRARADPQRRPLTGRPRRRPGTSSTDDDASHASVGCCGGSAWTSCRSSGTSSPETCRWSDRGLRIPYEVESYSEVVPALQRAAGHDGPVAGQRPQPARDGPDDGARPGVRRRRSFWLNVGILARTPWVVVHGRGAA